MKPKVIGSCCALGQLPVLGVMDHSELEAVIASIEGDAKNLFSRNVKGFGDPRSEEGWIVRGRSLILLLSASFLVFGARVGAQVVMPQSTLGNGGGLATDAVHGLHGTLGQIVSGMAEGPETSCRSGFWFSTELFCSDVDEPSSSSSMTYWLGPGCPNPFSRVAALHYSIPERCQVTIKLYDISGREVAALVDGEQDPGRYMVVLDGTELSSGIYLCQMTARGFRKTEKLLLLR